MDVHQIYRYLRLIFKKIWIEEDLVNLSLQLKGKSLITILSGVFQGKTTGTPISIIIYNEDKRSRDYETIKNKFRPGHADYTYFKNMGLEILEVEEDNLQERRLQGGSWSSS